MVESKGLKYQQWEKYGRMISPGQLDFYASKDMIIVWTLTDPDAQSQRVTLKGFSYAKDALAHGITENTPCNCVWLKDETYMHSIQ